MAAASVHPKVVAGGVGGAVVVVLLWVLSLFDVTPPAEVGAAMSTIAGFAAGYFKSA